MIALVVLLFPFKMRKLLCFGLAPFLFSCIIVAYGAWGGWFEWLEYQNKQKQAIAAQEVFTKLGSMQQVIEKMKAHIANTPKDDKAWFLLGRVYASTSDWQGAHEAFQMARVLDKQNHQYALHYAQSVWEINQHHFDSETHELLHKLLQENPDEADAIAMLALDAFESKQYKLAVNYWEKLLSLEPSDMAVQDKIKQAIAKARALAK